LGMSLPEEVASVRTSEFASGEMVAARVAFHGTHRGEFQGMPPTGKEVAFSSIEINRVADGKVEEHWVELDLLGLISS
jgi:predicted ester cyclase